MIFSKTKIAELEERENDLLEREKQLDEKLKDLEYQKKHIFEEKLRLARREENVNRALQHTQELDNDARIRITKANKTAKYFEKKSNNATNAFGRIKAKQNL